MAGQSGLTSRQHTTTCLCQPVMLEKLFSIRWRSLGPGYSAGGFQIHLTSRFGVLELCTVSRCLAARAWMEPGRDAELRQKLGKVTG